LTRSNISTRHTAGKSRPTAAKFFGLIERLGPMDPRVEVTRRAGSAENIARVAATSRRGQRRGLPDPSIDPATTACLLVSMTSNLCYWWFVGGEEHDDGHAAEELTEVWGPLA
jgi:hypothetical protein